MAILVARNHGFRGESSIRVEIAVPKGEGGNRFVEAKFNALAAAVAVARSYRGKVLSFEGGDSYSGKSTGVMVHRLPKVHRNEVILPAATLRLLERNILDFARNRGKLKRLGLSAKKGILLYGSPGTGKTHLVRYLAGALPDHTTLLITSEQAGLIGEYFTLARLLQPSLMVIEDADLIARARENMGSACEEVLLNKLLNEMDGLKEDADIFFILTTNRPEQLEGALTGRPGQIDQAIEFPVPDKTGRGKLVKLYARGLKVGKDVATEIVNRTEGVSAAFIKELMRRVAQSAMERGSDGVVALEDIDSTLQDMLFRGGRLNASLLGASAAAPG
ncbi:MAG: AAA family ATPase [Methylocella sp.]